MTTLSTAVPEPQTDEPAAGIVVADLSQTFGSVQALAEVTFAASAGEVVGLVGPNGCGKSTTLRLICGLTDVRRGAVTVAGLPAGSLAARARLAFVPDTPTGFDELTVSEYCALYASMFQASPAYGGKVSVLLTAFGLEGRLRARLGTLSTGMRRQVSISAALALGTEVVVVDEAAATLDPEAVIVLREALRAVARRGATVLLATQDLHFAQTACDRLVLLHRGRLLDQGSFAELRERHVPSRSAATDLEDVFLAALGQHDLVATLRRDLDVL